MSPLRYLPLMLGILWHLAWAAGSAAQGRATACCTVSAVNATSGVATGTVTATGNVFEFTARNRAALTALRVGQTLHVNFANNQVSLDGRSVWGTVTKAPAPATTVRQPPPAAAPGGPTTPVAGGRSLSLVAQSVLAGRPPAISFGAPVPHTPNTRQLALSGLVLPVSRYEARTIPATVGGRQIAIDPFCISTDSKASKTRRAHSPRACVASSKFTHAKPPLASRHTTSSIQRSRRNGRVLMKCRQRSR